MQQETKNHLRLASALTEDPVADLIRRRFWYAEILALVATFGLILLAKEPESKLIAILLAIFHGGLIVWLSLQRKGHQFPTQRLPYEPAEPVEANQPLAKLPNGTNLNTVPLKKGELKVWFDPATDVENDIVVMMPPKSRRTVQAQVLSVRKAEPLVVYEPSDSGD
jgi:hypothetical protein